MEKGTENCEEHFISTGNRKHEIENRLNLHIGKPYRLQIQNCVYDGIMTQCKIHICKNGFVPLKVKLEKGLFYHPGDPSEKYYFDEFTAGPNHLKHMGAFGIIRDEKGFSKARDRKRGDL